MAYKELGDSLLQLDRTTSAGATRQQLERIIESERRRVKWLTGTTIGLWILAAMGAVSLCIVARAGIRIINRVRMENGQYVWLQAGESNLDQFQHAEFGKPSEPFLMLAQLMVANVAVYLLSRAILGGAVLATALLFSSSRRATLREINGNLVRILEQMNQIRRPEG